MNGDRGGPSAREAQVHRALSSPVRQRILKVLRTDVDSVGVHGLAVQLGLHTNTVRSHLVVLEEANLVTSQPQPGEGPGRPRLVYRAVDQTDADDTSDGYRFLAEVLTSYLAATLADPAGAATEAGLVWGRHLVEPPAPFASVDPEEAVVQVVALLADFGFAPEWDDKVSGAPKILLRRCPFRKVAKAHPDVVCSIHLGLMQGALSELSVDVEVTRLLPFVEPNLCVSHLKVEA